MNLPEAVAKACQEPTLIDALTWIAIWENDRAVRQALKRRRDELLGGPEDEPPSSDMWWDTCFKVCFEAVLKAYPAKLALREQ